MSEKELSFLEGWLFSSQPELFKRLRKALIGWSVKKTHNLLILL